MKWTGLCLVASLAVGCASTSGGDKNYAVASGSVEPGTKVTMRGSPVDLYQTGTLKKGDDFAALLQLVDVKPPAAVTVVNVVPSIDTPVCEEQTHILGESSQLDPRVARVVISRDTAMAQQRFAREASLENITYGSDFKSGDFGKRSGLLMKGPELLARAVIVLDRSGKVAYMQVVPDVASLPDMNKAFTVANDLAKASK